MKKIIIDLKFIFINPLKINDISKLSKIEIIKHYLFYILLVFIISIFFGYLFISESNNGSFKHNNIDALSYCLTIPLYEEIIFRAPLKKNKKDIALFFTILIIIIYGSITLYDTSIFIISIFLIYLLFIFCQKEKVEKQYNNKTTLILIYSTELAFGLIHLVNFNFIEIFVFFYILLKSFIGFVLSIFRLKYGIVGSVLFHASINTISYLLSKL